MKAESKNGAAVILADRAVGLANYPHARIAGGLIFVSGVSCRRPDNTWEGVEELADGSWKSDISKQTAAVLENIRVILQSVGTDLDSLVDLTVFLVDMKDYAAFNKVYNAYFAAENGPARTTVAVRELPNPRLLIEIKAVALAPSA
ncbi:Endoribonuclease L-PSP/chorismate mutase-like protein [Polychytrium aggregatum]|uniref:Endoribonuclease L-PSP/chorismate mutase-like protein n=1 Tax=Polychytrium aggregatum TaxID=110093 RepID=UPI0022FF209A|nr:Endoribonuclease L-PSP/chorismate mutase-like protein [Polychytrium aggregatum]KAI9204446.1 Endoribonuclease L-PSP/chorismate mutase-like protein [Polychytrium aggregatum]